MSNASINCEGFGVMIEDGQAIVINKMLKMPDLNELPLDTELNAAQEATHEKLDAEFLTNLSLASRRDERTMAFLMLYSIDRSDYQIDLATVLENFNNEFSLALTQEHFATHLVAKVLDQRGAIDEDIKPYLKNWRFERLGCCTRILLCLALTELLHNHEVPSIVINEAIELAKQFAEKDAYKFINGVLDEICKARGLLGLQVTPMPEDFVIAATSTQEHDA